MSTRIAIRRVELLLIALTILVGLGFFLFAERIVNAALARQLRPEALHRAEEHVPLRNAELSQAESALAAHAEELVQLRRESAKQQTALAELRRRYTLPDDSRLIPSLVAPPAALESYLDARERLMDADVLAASARSRRDLLIPQVRALAENIIASDAISSTSVISQTRFSALRAALDSLEAQVLEQEQVVAEQVTLIELAHKSHPMLAALPPNGELPPSVLRRYIEAAARRTEAELVIADLEGQMVALTRTVDERSRSAARAEAAALAASQIEEQDRNFLRVVVLLIVGCVLLAFISLALWMFLAQGHKRGALNQQIVSGSATGLLAIVLAYQILPALALVLGGLTLIAVVVRYAPAPKPVEPPGTSSDTWAGADEVQIPQVTRLEERRHG
jgi:hypothetical protein